MGAGEENSPELYFDPKNLDLLRAAVGFHENPNPDFADRPFFREDEADNPLLMYMDNWNLPKNEEGLDTSSYVS